MEQIENLSETHRALSLECKKKAEQIILKYGQKNEFLTKFSPDAQAIFGQIKNRHICFMGKYPTLSEIDMTYGQATSAQWLVAQLTNLSLFTGAKNINSMQLVELSTIIAQEYYYLKISELLLFFYKFKKGDYGTFYGTFDPLVISQSLKAFCADRDVRLTRYEQEDRIQREAMEREQHPPMTREEYLARHRMK